MKVGGAGLEARFELICLFIRIFCKNIAFFSFHVFACSLNDFLMKSKDIKEEPGCTLSEYVCFICICAVLVLKELCFY